MVDIVRLKAVLDAGHPVTGAYSADNAAAIVQGNLVNLVEDVDFIEPWTIFKTVVPADYAALSAMQMTTFWGLLSMGSLPVDDPNVRQAMANMFGGTPTLTALVTLQTRNVSHFQKERLGTIYEGHIQQARAL